MIESKMLDKNRTYTSFVTIQPKYIIVHSVGTSRKPTKEKLFASWNKPAASKSVHGMVDASGGWRTLPLDVKGWHVGKKGNSITVGFEICEPENIVYADASHTRVDTLRYNPADPNVRADFDARYQNAVEMAAYMCRETGIKPGNVICHQEAARMGIATNHADVLHWFPLFGKSMDEFRRDVLARMRGDYLPPEETPEPEYPCVVRVTADVLNVRTGPGTDYPIKMQVRKGEAYTIMSELNGWGRLKSGAGWICLEYTEIK